MASLIQGKNGLHYRGSMISTAGAVAYSRGGCPRSASMQEMIRFWQLTESISFNAGNEILFKAGDDIIFKAGDDTLFEAGDDIYVLFRIWYNV
jgi:hypothetical protein